MAKKTGENVATLKEKFNKAKVDENVRKAIPFTHYWHNHFHIDAPFSLISDPNGLCNLNGVYHIFCQWNPVPENQNWHKNKSWMHTTTKDFVNYTMPELSLWPSDVHDKDGCHSGCGFIEDGKVRVFYTCNSRDEDYQRTVAQRFGTLQEDGSIKVDEIQVQGNPEGYTAHFRDPNFFYRNGKRYFAMAAQRMSDMSKSSRPTNGTTIIYGEKDGGGWEMLGEVKTDYYDFGYMWECPNILQFGDYDVMICCPQGVRHEEFQYQNHCLAGYFVGHLSLDSLEMLGGKFQELDKGFDFYSPQVFQHEGRHIMIGWIGMPDFINDIESAKDGWLYSLTMPRVLTLRQGHIYSQPVEEIKALRKLDTRIDIDSVNLKEFKETLPKSSEISLNLGLGDAKKIKITLDYEGEKVVFDYDKKTQVMTIDRNGMKLGGKGIRKFNDGKNFDVDLGVRKFKLFASQELAFNMFIDRTALEIFFQHGEEVATFLLYPEKDVAPKISVEADENLKTMNGHIWEMDSIKFE